MEKKLPEEIDQAQKRFDHPAPLRLMFQDEARFGRISQTRYCWCPKPLRPLTQAMVTQEYTYAYAAVSPMDGVLDTLILPSVNCACMQAFLDEVAGRHPDENILMAVDGAGWHRSRAIIPPGNLQLLFLPPYAPELNPVEHLPHVRDRIFRRNAQAYVDVIRHQMPFYYRTFLVLRQLTEYFPKMPSQRAKQLLLTPLRYKDDVIFAIPARMRKTLVLLHGALLLSWSRSGASS